MGTGAGTPRMGGRQYGSPRESDEMTFVSFDVETANRDRGSVCELGWTVVERGQIVSTESLLVKPPGDLNYFEDFNSRLHGIFPNDVSDAIDFGDGLNRFTQVLDGRLVVAHSAAFDIGAIRDGCLVAGISHPPISYLCSLVLSRRTLALVSYRLPIVASELGVPITGHHRSGDDSRVTAGVTLEIARRMNCDSIGSLASSLMVRIGVLISGQLEGVSSVARPIGGWGSGPPDPNREADPEHPLFGKVLVFTGALSMTRAEAWEWSASVGAVPQKGVTRRTDVLVVGDGFTGESIEDFASGKAKKAIDLRAKGQMIEVMTERDFIESLADLPPPASILH